MLAIRLFGIGLVAYVLSWLSYDHYRPWVNFHAEALAFLALTLFVASMLANRTVIKIPKKWGQFFAICIIFVCLQYTFKIVYFAGDALMSSIYLAGFFCAISAGYTLARSESIKDEYLLIGWVHAVWISALISAFIGILQWFNLQVSWGMYVMQPDLGDRALGNLGQPNQLGTLLLMGVAALMYVFAKRRVGIFSIVSGVTILTTALVLTQSRAGLVSVILMAAFAVYKRKYLSSSLSIRWLFVWVLGFLLVTIYLPSIAELLLLDSTRNMSFGGGSTAQRIVIWKQVIYAILESPWVGYGWNQTTIVQAAGVLAQPDGFSFTYSHNIILDILAWCGLPMGLFIVGVSTYWVLSRMILIREPTAIYAFIALIPILTHSIFEYPFAYAYFLISAGLLIGVAESKLNKSTTISLAFLPTWVAMLIWVPLASYLVYEYLLIEEDFRVVRLESLRIGITPADYEVPRIILLTHMGQMLQVGRVQPRPNMKHEEIENLRRVTRRFAYSAISNRYAIALALNGETDKARHELAIIKGMYSPNHYDATMEVLRELRRTKYPALAPLVD